MTKKEAERLLLQGKKIGEIFDLVPGQECMIYKGEWPDDTSSEDIIYIPDIDLNELDDSDVPVSEKLSLMYTAGDFLKEAGGNILAAKDLFNFVDWQNPNIQDLIDCTDDEEAKLIYGETWEEMLSTVRDQRGGF